MKKIIQFFTFKKLDWYVVNQYIGPFFVTFFLAWFVLVMQFFWLYIDDLIGKGIDTKILLKFIAYTSSTLIPMALPLAILLSSIMTMGKFGENSELTSAKSNGISLFRFFKSTIIFSIFVSIFAFYFSNFIYTKTKAVAMMMLSDIRNLKPSLIIKPKQFYNGISGITIRVDSSDEQTGTLYNVKIYDHARGMGNQSITFAKSLKLSQSDDGKVLIFRLDSGVRYNDDATNSFDNLKYPFYAFHFSKFEKRFDLTQFKLSENFNKDPDAARMSMNMTQLNHGIDSIKQDIIVKKTGFSHNFYTQNNSLKLEKSIQDPIVKLSDSIQLLSAEDKIKLKIISENKARNVKNNLFTYNSDNNYSQQIRKLLDVEWHRKFTLAISCLVLFFVGAPLGAIIKKGGIGLPMFIAVILFIIFFMLSKGMSELAMNFKISPFLGMWFSTLLFLPFGIFLTYKAMNDSQIMNIEGFQLWIGEIIHKWRKK